MVEPFVNSKDPEQTLLHLYAVSDLGLHCFLLSHKLDEGFLLISHDTYIYSIYI